MRLACIFVVQSIYASLVINMHMVLRIRIGFLEDMWHSMYVTI